MKINVQQILPFLIPNENSISNLIYEILILEDRLENSVVQSEYFRWGLRSQIERLHRLKNQYECILSEYNDMTVDELIDARTEREIFVKDVVPNIHPRLIRSIVSGSAISTINKLNDHIQLKSVTLTLPTLEGLKSDTELLLKILNL